MQTAQLFLSTPSARRATPGVRGIPAVPLGISIHALREEGDQVVSGVTKGVSDFYPRPPRGGRPFCRCFSISAGMISIHALREEGDERRRGAVKEVCIFLSTPSARRATTAVGVHTPPPAISIHALREEGDHRTARTAGWLFYFYPRPPRGGRPVVRHRKSARKNFYPRPPRGGRPATGISGSEILHFYPRPPRGGRQQKQRQKLYFQTNYTTFCTNLEEP